jgi:uncharacterized phiE125 gp8 family phage protein
MYTTLVTPAASEPITLAEAKVVCAVDGDITGEDTHITQLIQAARSFVQVRLAVAGNPLRLAVETWRMARDYWPRSAWLDFKVLPVVSVTGVAYQDAAGAGEMTSMVLDGFYLDAANARLHVLSAWPTVGLGLRGVEVTFTAGYVPDASDPLRQAMMMLIAHWFENREAVVAGTEYRAEAVKVPLGFDDLLAPHLVRRVI